MADDLAFLFNDPAPPAPMERSTRPQPHTAAALPAGIDWKTLREAHDETSIPVSTLRKWAKRGKVRARLVREDGRDLRLVAFGDVIDRARALERQVHPSNAMIDLRHPDRVEAILETQEMAAVAVEEPEAGRTEMPVQPAAEEVSADLLEPVSKGTAPSEPSPDQAAGAGDHTAHPEGGTMVPEGSILVPIDAWDRLLGQLGNLHEAGQQLADARERAAKAETEVEFLRERLREMRKRAEGAELAVDLQQRDRELPTVDERPEPTIRTAWRRLVDRLAGR